MTEPVQSWPGIVVVTGPALRVAADAIRIAARNRRLSGLPSSRLYDQLAQAFSTAAKSATGQKDVPSTAVPELSPTVPVSEAAKRIGLSYRQTRRLAPKLGGRIVAGRWLLDDTAITEHLEGRR